METRFLISKTILPNKVVYFQGYIFSQLVQASKVRQLKGKNRVGNTPWVRRQFEYEEMAYRVLIKTYP